LHSKINQISEENPFSEDIIAFKLREVLEVALNEDLGFGDITGESVLKGRTKRGEFSAKSEGILSGTSAIELGYSILDDSVEVKLKKGDGEKVKPGDVIAEVQGPAKVLLTGERVILNLIQHLSGIATATSLAAEALRSSSTRVCDTRKTIPGLRALQKYAVRCGGGYNHRMRLDDGIMIKDNHIKAAGGIQAAIYAARSKAGLMVKIEVECETRGQVLEAVNAGADIIMLDNRTPEEARELRKIIPENIIVELSGGIHPETVGKYRDCGADYISIGALTHSVKVLDISFNLI
jgi:nicotinate-nucleotide pyrophosphorylase (carboxylating)